MAEALGLVATCVGLIETVNKLCKTARRYVHTHRSAAKELGALIGKLSSYGGLLEGIQLQARFDEGNKERLSVLEYKDGPLDACRKALANLEARLGKLHKWGKLGKVVDDETATYLKAFDDALPILQLALESDQSMILLKVQDYVKGIRHDMSTVKDIVTEQKAKQIEADNEKEKQRLGDWLTTINPTSKYDEHLQNASPNSGNWFLEKRFRSWLQERPGQNPRILWLRGMSGMGKSTLLTLAINHVSSKVQWKSAPVVAYFYCSSDEDESQDVQVMMKSYIKQLCQQVPESWAIVAELETETNPERKVPSIGQLEKCFQRICQLVSSVVLFLDAPNEANDPHRLIKAIATLYSQNKNIQIMITSTESLSPFRTLDSTWLVLVNMSASDVNNDISNYIYWKTKENTRLRRIPDHVQRIVQEKLAAKAQGSFRWVECQVDALVNNTRSQAAIERALDSMSPGLETVYTGTLEGIPLSDRSLIRNALLWLTLSFRPMTRDELGEAIIFNGYTESVSPAHKLFREEFKDILRNCRILIKYNDEYKNVTLAHDSVREYLFSESCFKKANPYSLNAEVDACLLCCLMTDYLNMPVFSSGYCASRAELRARFEAWPILEYTSTALPKLLEAISWENPAQDTKRMRMKLQTLFGSATQPRGGNFGAFIQASSPWTDLSGQTFSPLYFAASKGLAKALRFILSTGLAGRLEQPGGYRKSTPLHVACTFGHTKVVKLLLEAKANPNETNMYKERGIEWAYLHGHNDIVQMLLDHGAEPVSKEGVNRIREKVEDARRNARDRIVVRKWKLAAGVL